MDITTVVSLTIAFFLGYYVAKSSFLCGVNAVKDIRNSENYCEDNYSEEHWWNNGKKPGFNDEE